MGVDSMPPSPVNSVSIQSNNYYTQYTWGPYGGTSVGGVSEPYTMCTMTGALGLSSGVVTAGTLAVVRPGGKYPPNAIIPLPIYAGNSTPTVQARAHLQTDATGRVTGWVLDDGGAGYTGTPFVGVPAPYNAPIVAPLPAIAPGYCQAVNIGWVSP